MWTCPKCKRIFKKAKQPHSCKKVPLLTHFAGKEKAKEIFDYLVEQINNHIGKSRIISIPCCIHLFGKYDFLAALPKKDGLEIRFALGRKLISPRLKTCVPMSAKVFKNCFAISSKEQLDDKFLNWLKQSYNLKG